eukprot:764665-Hanusia_phi.AAC.1
MNAEERRLMRSVMSNAMLMACLACVGLTSSSLLHRPPTSLYRRALSMPHLNALAGLARLRGGRGSSSEDSMGEEKVAPRKKKRSYKHLTVFDKRQDSDSSSDMATKRHRKLTRISQKPSTTLEKVFKDRPEKALVEVEHQKLQVDPRNLCVFDPWTELGEYPQDNVEQYEELLEQKSKNAIAALIGHLRSLPPVVEQRKNNQTEVISSRVFLHDISVQVHVSLPKPKELIPSIYEKAKKKQVSTPMSGLSLTESCRRNGSGLHRRKGSRRGRRHEQSGWRRCGQEEERMSLTVRTAAAETSKSARDRTRREADPSRRHSEGYMVPLFFLPSVYTQGAEAAGEEEEREEAQDEGGQGDQEDGGDRV